MPILTALLQDLLSLALRLTLIVAGFIFVLSLIAAAGLGLVGVLVWRLATGRRPVIPRWRDVFQAHHFQFDPRMRAWAGVHTGRFNPQSFHMHRPRTKDKEGVVIDAEVREIPEGTRVSK